MIISLKRSFFLFEQGIISLLNFSLIFVLSKLIAPSLFKDFFLGYSIVSIISLITSSFANQPLQVFFKKNENNFHYFLKTLVLNIVILVIVSIICFLIINSYYEFLTNSLWYIFSLGFSVSIYDTLRRVSFVYFQENFLANACASFSIFIGFFLMMSTNYYVFGAISINRLYFFLIIAYTLGSFTFLALAKNKIKRILQLPKNGDRILFLELLKKHANYAFWLVLGIILFWTYTQGIYFISEKHIAIEDFNAVRISQNLVGVLSVFILAFENIMLTKTAEVFREKKYLKLDSYIKGVIKKNLLPFVGLVLISALVIIIIFKTYYNNNVFYSEKAIYLAYFLMYQFVFGLSRIFVVALKAMDQTIHIFLNHFYTCIATILIGIYFLPKFSNGHVLAIVMLISQIIFSAGAFFSYKKVILKNIISQQ